MRHPWGIVRTVERSAMNPMAVRRVRLVTPLRADALMPRGTAEAAAAAETRTSRGQGWSSHYGAVPLPWIDGQGEI